MTFTQDTTLNGNAIQTSSSEVLSTSKTFGNQPNHHYIVILKTGALPTLPTLLGNRSQYTFRNTTGSPINLALTTGETVDGVATTFPLAANAQTMIVSEISAAVGWTVLSFAPPTGAVVGTTDTQTLPNKTLTAPVINGAVTGTGVASASTASTLAARDAQANLLADLFIPGRTSTVTAGATTTLTIDSTQVQVFTGSSNQVVKMPTTGVTTGMMWIVVNVGSGTVTAQTSDGTSFQLLTQNKMGVFAARVDTPTTGSGAGGDWTVVGLTGTQTSSVYTTALRDNNANLLADNFISTRTSTVTSAGTLTMTIDSAQTQVFTGSTTHTVLLPTTGIVAGQEYRVVNNSTNSVAVQSSGANAVATVLTNTLQLFVAQADTPTATAHWRAI